MSAALPSWILPLAWSGIAALATALWLHRRWEGRLRRLRRRNASLHEALQAERRRGREQARVLEILRGRVRSGLSPLEAGHAPREPGEGPAFTAALRQALGAVEQALAALEAHARRGELATLVREEARLLAAAGGEGEGSPEDLATALADLPGVEAEGGPPRFPLLLRRADGGRVLVDRAPASEAYRDALQAPDANIRRWHLERHARRLREAVQALADRRHGRRAELAVLLVPGDAYLAAALEVDRDLVEEALERGVGLCSPLGLRGLLQGAALERRQEELARAGRHLLAEGEALAAGLEEAAGRLLRLGEGLSAGLEDCRQLLESLRPEREPMPAGRRAAAG